jgi:hypothetical protein
VGVISTGFVFGIIRSIRQLMYTSSANRIGMIHAIASPEP